MSVQAQHTVLLIENDIVVRHPLAEYLRECGFTVIEVTNGTEARLVLTSPRLQIDVVLVDMNAPDSGFTLYQWIRQNHPSAEVILSATVEKAVERAGALCNEGPALAKPYDHHLVLDHIRQALARRDREKP
jgi:DNA-binding NtrC family response regulator